MTQDILIIGGGAIGLSLAVELKLRGASVTVKSRNFREGAIHAAAGMIAPQAERIPPGPMLDLCLRSRQMYPEWTRQLAEISGLALEYWPCGILAPAFAAPSERESTPARVSISGSGIPAYWMDRDEIREYQPGLGTEVVGGWWFPEDGQIDNQMLARSLWVAARKLGVKLEEGSSIESIERENGEVVGVRTRDGIERADRYVLATGAWSEALLPIPVSPKKGQMLSVRVPPGEESRLQRILFGPGTYIVPRRRDRIIIGATSEDVGFTPGNTPGGMRALLDRARSMYPMLENYPIDEFWWGFRPATPDELPILGASPWGNLTLATGHYRNGILLAPVSAALLTDSILGKPDPLLEAFDIRRFDRPEPLPSPALATSTNNHHPMSSNLTSPNPRSIEFAVPSTLATSPENRLTIARRPFHSRLMTGSGKYSDFDRMQQSIAASGCQIVTVAVRRVQTNAPGHEGLAEALDWSKLWMLPNTAGCKTAEEAIRVARLGREMAKLLGQEDNNFVKLEVIPDPDYLLPDPIGTLEAAEQLVKEGFAVLPYINADPMLARRLEDAGCATVMPLGSPIGSGQGIQTAANIQIIIDNAKIPVVVDAGIGTPSEAAQAMEMGADAVLINSAIALAKNPPAMARAMGMAVEAGRLAYLAGRIPVKDRASASSPQTGTIASV
ncbi:MAG: glycine oxidase ThiO [Cyanobacteriota bacterium]|nr:glycine oxidase ThiO [Cyanobacteriota bacterium]